MNGTYRRIVMGFLALAALADRAAAQANGSPPRADTAATRSVLTGAYSAPQARSGEAVFKRICAQCHVVQQFSDADFRRAWSGRTARDLFDLIRSQMPQDNPGSLTRAEYASVLAYFFELNGYPPGDAPLPTDTAGLRRVRIERKDSTTTPPRP